MSIVNIAFEKERILCLTDTLQYKNEAPAGLRPTKCVFTPSFAVTTRGLVRAGDAVKAAALECGTVNEAAEGIPQLLRAILNHADGDSEYDTEVFLMGWSDAKSDLITYRWLIQPGESGEVEFNDLPRGLHIAPTFLLENIPPPPTIDDARMVKVALAQHKVVNHMNLRMCVGGIMHLTEITPYGTSQRIAGLYPDYWEHAQKFGCPNAEEVAAFTGPKVRCA